MNQLWMLSVFLTVLSIVLYVSYSFLPRIYSKFRLRSYFTFSKKEQKQQNKKETKIILPSIQKWFDEINVIFKGKGIPINAKEFFLIVFWIDIILLVMFQIVFGWLSGFIIIIAIKPVYYLVLVTLKKRRRKRMIEQVPDVLELISSALKTGYSVIQTIDLVAKEDFEPLSEEFQQVYQAIRFGHSLEKALLDFESRVEIEEITALVDTIIITRETGGNLTSVIDRLLETLREKRQVKREIQSLTSQGRISATIVSILPFALFTVLFVINSEYMGLLFTHPIGLFLIGLSITMQVIGMIFMRRIINLKVR